MVLSPLTPSDRADLPSGCRPLGGSSSQVSLRRQLKIWRQPALKADLLLVLGGTRTAEWPGISAAGSTPVARRLTALADAELLLRGPGVQRHWPLPELPAGVSPALLSRVVVETLGLAPVVVALGLPRAPDFAHLRIESAFEGPSSCLSGGVRCRRSVFNGCGGRGSDSVLACVHRSCWRSASLAAPRRPKQC